MALARRETWYTQANADYPDVTTTTRTSMSFCWLLKEMLTHTTPGTAGPEGVPIAGSLWTVEGSSDGVTAGLDAVDRLATGTFDATKYVVANEGAPHSWIVLKSPAAMGPLYMCINGPLTASLAAFTMSTNAFTGGTTSNRPTSVGQWTLAFNGGGANTVNIGGAAAQKFHLVRNAAGSFYVLAGRPGSGWFHTFMALAKLSDSRSNDQAPYISFFHARDDNRIGDWFNTFASGTCGAYSQAYNLSAETMNQPVGQMQGFLGLSPTDGTLNSSNSDGTLDATPLYTAYFNTAVGGFNGLKGRWPDAYILDQRMSPGSMVPSISPFLFTATFALVLPFSVLPSV